MLKQLARKTSTYNKLNSALRGGKLFHAIMLAGDDDALAKEVAKAIAADILSVGHGEGAYEIIQNKVDKSIHPDLKVFGEEKVLDAAGAREITSSALTKPYEGDNKVYIIHNFDDIGPAPANILLKTIEEPPAGAYFLLLVRNENRVLQTILSRSQRYYLDELEIGDIEEILKSQGIKDAGIIAAESGGNLTKALSLGGGGAAGEVYNFVLDTFLNLNSTLKFGEYVAKLDKLKNHLADVLEFFMIVSSDIIKLKLGKLELIKNKHLVDKYKEISPRWPFGGLVLVADSANEARTKVDKKINYQSIIDQFLLKIVEVQVKCRR